MTEYVLRGLPRSLRLDGWWLTESIDDYSAPRAPDPIRRSARPRNLRRGTIIALLALILAADLLFWRQAPGLSVAVFAAALILALSVTCGFIPKGRERTVWMAALALSLLPTVEQVQMLSLIFALAGLLAFAVRISLVRPLSVRDLISGMARLAATLPWVGALDGFRAARDLAARPADAAAIARFRRAWALPLSVGAFFILAFISANPIIDGWVSALIALDWDAAPLVRRLAFWGAVAAFIWPFLTCDARSADLRRPFAGGTSGTAWGIPGVNAASISNSLILFNLIFAVQTALDLAYLWGGVALPPGTSHAEYAHRGAYPLVATALLAGAFALISRPYASDRPGLRLLLAVWLLQNVALVVSSIYRLDLYVDTYGLTYLRLRAAIWMVLVVIGLVLLGFQLIRSKSNLWLVCVNAALLVATLYVCAFVNFADLIARYNLDHIRRNASLAPDYSYICALGPNAAPGIADHLGQTGLAACSPDQAAGPVTQGWRDWGFRKWRVQRYLAANAAAVNGRAIE